MNNTTHIFWVAFDQHACYFLTHVSQELQSSCSSHQKKTFDSFVGNTTIVVGLIMVSNQEQAGSASLAAATRVTKLDSHTYRVELDEAFCIGNVPNGGYASSCMLAAASEHLSSRDQRDTLTAHFEYPSRTSPGPAIVKIEDVKISGQLSTLHLALWQGGLVPHAPWTTAASRRAILAYTTHTNLAAFTGISLPTGFEGTAAAENPPLPDFEALKSRGVDDTWEESRPPRAALSVARSLQNWNFYVPRQGPLAPGVLDMWTRLSSGERITQGALPYVVDSFPYNLHEFLAAPELRELLQAGRKGEAAGDSPEGKDIKAKDEQRAGMWFPTVVMNLEMKTALPEDGVEWLAVRVTSKQIKEGKFDLDISVRDVHGELLVLSHHVAMILSIERNTRKSRSSL
ncbi:hypothetical protein KVR01_013362 [Diaporthe batatas]|uniref:uncharacterized protein n=1 Tax=Diaporthe batatas TaxID=748121 RepID=UPI001D059421|nr:uncharacterized protein KVR01_013362 [Diaporthe batatas]KAG8156757.1 hypothetical protein KVR01_013362 [Diaporthe batatas]